MLNSKQKKFFRSEAHSLKPIFQVGKDGVGEKQINSINDALKAKELIKVKLLDTCPETVNEVALMGTKADVVHIIGHTIIFFKSSEKGIYKI